jgi:predicted nucleic acid-binding protein
VADFVVVLDANVLYPIGLADLLVTMGRQRLYRPHWSAEILDEVRRNVVADRPDIDPARVEKRLSQMCEALPDALQVVPKSLVDAMPIVEHDRHVLALAVAVGADSIVTQNLKDFPADVLEDFGLEAIDADTLVTAQVGLDAPAVDACIDAMAARLKAPPISSDELKERLARQLPRSMEALRAAERA